MVVSSLLQTHKWRSSSAFIVFTAVLALFTQTFLYNFLLPILSYMLETRLHLPPSQTQRFISALLTCYGVFSSISAPIIAHFIDKTPDRKTPLLISFGGCIVGTVLMSFTPSAWVLFLGCMIQAFFNSAGWVIAFTTLADNVEMDNLGKTLGMATSFVAAGGISGPVVSGTILELVGYWAAWAVPLVLLLVSLVVRFVAIEVYHKVPVEDEPPSDHERATLLASRSDDLDKSTPHVFYGVILRDIHVIVGLLNTLTFSVILIGVMSTLPLHLRSTFGWGSLPTGMIFLGLEMPGVLLGPLVGWLRDRVGLRYPTTVGWVLFALLLWLLGIPGREGFGWASPDAMGKAIFIAGSVGIGAAMSLVRGVATLQLMAVLDDIQSQNPGIFGAHGASSRVISTEQATFNLGMIIGPLLAGPLSDALGFYYLTCILGKDCIPHSSTKLMVTAAIALGVGLFSFGFLVHKTPPH